jgi:hypothetical protein
LQNNGARDRRNRHRERKSRIGEQLRVLGKLCGSLRLQFVVWHISAVCSVFYELSGKIFFCFLFFTQKGTPHILRFDFWYTVIVPAAPQETVEEAGIEPGTAALQSGSPSRALANWATTIISTVKSLETLIFFKDHIYVPRPLIYTLNYLWFCEDIRAYMLTLRCVAFRIIAFR